MAPLAFGGAPLFYSVPLKRDLRQCFARGSDLVFSGFGFPVKAMRSALVLDVSRLRLVRFSVLFLRGAFLRSRFSGVCIQLFECVVLVATLLN